MLMCLFLFLNKVDAGHLSSQNFKVVQAPALHKTSVVSSVPDNGSGLSGCAVFVPCADLKCEFSVFLSEFEGRFTTSTQMITLHSVILVNFLLKCNVIGFITKIVSELISVM